MSPEQTLRDQVAIVTGGGTGIGKVIAKTLGILGAKVVIASRKSDVLDAAVAELEKDGVIAKRVVADVRLPEQVDALIEETLKSFSRLDILVNNAAGNFVVPAEELTPNGFRTVVDIVLNGTFNCSRAAGRHWIRQNRPGCIVNMIASYAWTGAPGVVHSAAAKAGVLNMTLTLAGEWGPKKIRVNAVSPGIVVTANASKNLGYDDPQVQKVLSQMIPLRRLANAEEVAQAVAYLCSPQASYVTGTCLSVDGGLWLGRGLFGTMEELTKMKSA